MLRILLCVWTCGVSAPLDYYQQVTQQVMQGAATRNAGTSRRLRQLSNQLRRIARSCTQLHKWPQRLLTNGSLRGKAWRALHAQSRSTSCAAHCEQHIDFSDPPPSPFHPPMPRQGAASSQDASTHTTRARETHASQAAKAGRHDQDALCSLARACWWRV